MNEQVDTENWQEKIKEYKKIIDTKKSERNSIMLQLNKHDNKNLKFRYDDIGYDLIDAIAKKSFFEIMDDLSKRKKSGVILKIENYGDKRKRIRRVIKKMTKQIKALNLSNRVLLYNKLTAIYSEWEYSFQSSSNFPEMKEAYYAKMKSRMWCNWFLFRRATLNKFFRFFRFLGLFILWIVSGFGERPTRVIILAMTIAPLFALIFYYLPGHFQICNDDYIFTEYDRFIHLCCVSINVMTSLEITGIEPKTNFGRICITGEILVGAVALLFLIPILINRLSGR